MKLSMYRAAEKPALWVTLCSIRLETHVPIANIAGTRTSVAEVPN